MRSSTSGVAQVISSRITLASRTGVSSSTRLLGRQRQAAGEQKGGEGVLEGHGSVLLAGWGKRANH